MLREVNYARLILLILMVLTNIKTCRPEADTEHTSTRDTWAESVVIREGEARSSENQCALTINVPLTSLQTACKRNNMHQHTADVKDQITKSQKLCEKQIKEAERKFQYGLLHEATVRLELEQRFLQIENTTKFIEKFYKETDFPTKELLQYILNRLHLEKLAREDLETEVARLQHKLQVYESHMDCEYIQRPGVYRVHPLTLDRFVEVYCDRGWTVIQRRINGNVDFYRGWQSYQDGFGDLEGEFWLGNDHIHAITNQSKYRLKIEMTDWEGEMFYLEYEHFQIDSIADNYRLHVWGHHGNIQDGLNQKGSRHDHNGMPFSTFDRNNQPNRTSYCAEIYHGAWWYNSCYASNLNGRYCKPTTDSEQLAQCMVWWGGSQNERVVMKTVTMKIRETRDNILFLEEVEEN